MSNEKEAVYGPSPLHNAELIRVVQDIQRLLTRFKQLVRESVCSPDGLCDTYAQERNSEPESELNDACRCTECEWQEECDSAPTERPPKFPIELFLQYTAAYDIADLAFVTKVEGVMCIAFHKKDVGSVCTLPAYMFKYDYKGYYRYGHIAYVVTDQKPVVRDSTYIIQHKLMSSRQRCEALIGGVWKSGFVLMGHGTNSSYLYNWYVQDVAGTGCFMWVEDVRIPTNPPECHRVKPWSTAT